MFERIEGWRKRNWYAVWLFLMVVLVSVASYFVSARVHSETILGHEGPCISLSGSSRGLTKLRDEGMDYDLAKTFIAEKLAEAKGKPESFIKDDEDVAEVLGILMKIYHHSEMNADAIVAQVKKVCIKSEQSTI